MGSFSLKPVKFMPARPAPERRDKKQSQKLLEHALPICAPDIGRRAIRTKSIPADHYPDVRRLRHR
jgi:hypothetical protein